ncbi:MAG: gamma-glutamylcyclotransferase [Thermosynechococcaceae cyanobacterium MS004]|nr:gamma-glutamylcyclotransferase [Thermosynechococcaceae cyanobacterium MS004]
MLKIFVYGTLKPGQCNDQYCRDRQSAETAWARGQLFKLPVGYPAMTKGTQWVKGVLLTFADDTFEENKILSRLDALEDYSPYRPASENEYQRDWIEVFTIETITLETIALEIIAPEAFSPDMSNTSTPKTQADEMRSAVAKSKSLGYGWAYFMEPERVQQIGGRLISEGEWTGD